jgi:Ca2+/Na+ antiporter
MFIVVYVIYVCTVIGMYFSAKRNRKIKIENESTEIGNTEVELGTIYRQNGVTDVRTDSAIVDNAEEEGREDVEEIEDVEIVTRNNGNSCITNFIIIRDFTLKCIENTVAALIPSLTPVPYPCRSSEVCLCMMCASEKMKAREREKEKERLRNREQEKVEKEFLLDSSRERNGNNSINNSASNDDGNNDNNNYNNNKDKYSINIGDNTNNNNNDNNNNDLELSTIDINVVDTPTSAFNKNEKKRAWEIQNPLHTKNTKNTQNTNNNTSDDDNNDIKNSVYSDESHAYVTHSYVPLWRAVACLIVCLFYVGLLASAIVQLCEKLSHLVGVGGSTVGATLVALGSEVRTLYRTFCLFYLFIYFFFSFFFSYFFSCFRKCCLFLILSFFDSYF